MHCKRSSSVVWRQVFSFSVVFLFLHENCLLTFPPGFGNPTSIDFVWTNMHQMVASYQAAKVMTFDLETGQCVVNLDSGSTYGESAV